MYRNEMSVHQKLPLRSCNHEDLGGWGPRTNLTEQPVVTAMFVKVKREGIKDIPLTLAYLLRSATPKAHQGIPDG